MKKGQSIIKLHINSLTRLNNIFAVLQTSRLSIIHLDIIYQISAVFSYKLTD